MNINNSSFISFLDNTYIHVQKKVSLDNYFELSKEQKLNVSYNVFNLIKNNTTVTFSDNDYKTFITILLKKTEKDEKYEFASVLNDIIKKYDIINKLVNDKKNEIKLKKSEKHNNG